MRRVYTFLVIILILAFSIKAGITSELADQIYNAAPDEMISCIVVIKTRYPHGEVRSEQVRSRIHVIRKLLSLRYKWRKLSFEELGIGGIRSSKKSYTINKYNFNHF